jgi:hypothetical protein
MGQSIIKVTIFSAGEGKTSHFPEEIVIIGDGHEAKDGEAFLSLPGIGLKPEHLKLIRQDKHLFVQNMANDPFVTLDNLPFYKKEVTNGMVVRVKDREIRIELVTEKEGVPAKEKISQPSLPQEEPSFEEEVFHAAPLPKMESDPPPLKEIDAFVDEDEKETGEKSWISHLNVSPFRNVRLFSFFMMVFFLVFSMIAVETYLRAGEKSDEDEVKAAEALSDIAMALTYAQFYHIPPQKHNWSDPAFIQNNLLAMLPTGSSSATTINSQGDFTSCPYFLRVYTSNDLSRFLVVAHPNPTFLQWLIPKNALALDSNSMEIRRIRNVKAMNRLLANLNTLDGLSLTQITDLLKREEVVPLSYIAQKGNMPEFEPPKFLSFLRPGAENLVYNAPRYHPFGDALLKKAGQFASSSTSSHELAMLQSELEVLKKFPNLVLYTTKSIEEAKEGIYALKQIGPHQRYILASIKYDAEGHFRSSKIVMDQEKRAISPLLLPSVPYVTEAAVFTFPENRRHDNISFGIPQDASDIAEAETVKEIKEDPLFTALKTIKSAKDSAQETHRQEAYRAVDSYLEAPQKKKLLKELRRIQALIREEDVKAKEAIFELSLENTDSSFFEEQLEKAQLKDFWNEK